MARYKCRKCNVDVYTRKPLNINEKHDECGEMMFPDWDHTDVHTDENKGSPD